MDNSRPDDDVLSGLLADAVRAVREEAPPIESMNRALARGERIPRRVQFGLLPLVATGFSWKLPSLSLAVALLLMVGISMVQITEAPILLAGNGTLIAAGDADRMLALNSTPPPDGLIETSLFKKSESYAEFGAARAKLDEEDFELKGPKFEFAEDREQFRNGLEVLHIDPVMVKEKAKTPAPPGPSPLMETSDSQKDILSELERKQAIQNTTAQNTTAQNTTSYFRWMQTANNVPLVIANGDDESRRLGYVNSEPKGGNRIHLWNYATQEPSKPLDLLSEKQGAVSPDGRYVVTPAGDFVDLNSDESFKLPRVPQNARAIARFSNQGKALAWYVTVGEDEQIVEITSFPEAETLCRIPTANEQPAIYFNLDDTEVILPSPENKLQRFSLNQCTQLILYPTRHVGNINSITVSHDGALLASGDSESVRVFDVKTGGLQKELKPANADQEKIGGMVTALAFSRTDQYLAAGFFGRVIVWDTHSLKPIYQNESFNTGVQQVDFDSDEYKLRLLTAPASILSQGRSVEIGPAVLNLEIRVPIERMEASPASPKP